jgi:hypothetical protein
MTSHLTQGVALHEQRDTGALLRTMQAAAETAVRFGAAIVREVPASSLEAYRSAADSLIGLTRGLTGSGRLVPEDLDALAAALGRVTQAYLPLLESRTR